ncbi:hypothetical protein [Mesorhizobium sp. M1B.F.Ca.ET.045.04.1.1]|uniref:hypothetical protein n=1 Tax=Mesorhizobium sp. M1B.F.Ca.ET.045.04.1.1 TaxID=2493673 RepID=UPI000F74DDBF|nr:hypothetical protein [Mesorhizobium sp. M1B.F.Ca.ET.045.04.1.1]AZO29371.1 hypothetical protein EJ071_19590 [Mesorhizobium sp. M1B.F.Ca.ET.045.04.1.1]
MIIFYGKTEKAMPHFQSDSIPSDSAYAVWNSSDDCYVQFFRTFDGAKTEASRLARKCAATSIFVG